MGVQVRHNARLAAAVGMVASIVTVAWFSRALQSGALLDWALCLVVGAIGVVQLLVVRDSRAPLMLADEQGVRIRRGETWSGLPWQEIDHVAVQSRATGWRGLLHDGRIVLHPRAASDEDGPVSPYVVPLAVTTVVEAGKVSPETEDSSVADLDEHAEPHLAGALTGDLVGDLDLLAAGRTQVLVLTRSTATPRTRALRRPTRAGQALTAGDPEEATDASTEKPTESTDESTQGSTEGSTDALAARGRPAEPAAEPEEHFEPVDPARPTRPAARAEVVRDTVRMLPDPPAIPAQRSSVAAVVARIDAPTDGDVAERGQAPVPAPVAGVIGEQQPGGSRPTGSPVIGPLVGAARLRARLSIDELSERTRIRPHVLESIEVDDFEPCGGDFYARGHLRSLARVFGLDAAILLALYDEHYAHAEIEARQVFEAELASGIGGGMRATVAGPRWSLLAACVVALALVWGAARVFTDTPDELVSPAPDVVDTAGLASGDTAAPPKSTLAPLRVSAAGASPQVVVRDRDGRILWAGKLAAGQSQQVIGLAPFEVTASNGAAVKVALLGKPKGTVGPASAASSRSFG